MAERNPPWSRDELILALDLYMRHRPRLPSKGGPEVSELSAVLNQLHRQLGRAMAADLRNPAGCYMKLQNFRRFDPDYTATGRKGLKAGNKEEGPVWGHFAHDPSRLSDTAFAIRAVIVAGGPELSQAEAIVGLDDDAEEAEEGRTLSRLHTYRERNKAVVARCKDAALKATNKLACAACGFDYLAIYGERGRGFIECHHTKPLHTLRPGDKTRIADLVLVCANCHRMIHAKRAWLSLEELRQIVQRPA